jgi:anti-sigma B factor antagonist
MLDTGQGHDDLQAAIDGDTIFVRVIGRGSFKISATLKQFLMDIPVKHSVRLIVLDLAECIGMDSTFMGVLAGISGRLKENGQRLELINLSEKNAKLLGTLGVDQVIAHYSHSHGHEVPSESAETLPTEKASKKELAETALNAHKDLVKLSAENHPRFKRVIEYLEADVDRLN